MRWQVSGLLASLGLIMGLGTRPANADPQRLPPSGDQDHPPLQQKEEIFPDEAPIAALLQQEVQLRLRYASRDPEAEENQWARSMGLEQIPDKQFFDKLSRTAEEPIRTVILQILTGRHQLQTFLRYGWLSILPDGDPDKELLEGEFSAEDPWNPDVRLGLRLRDRSASLTARLALTDEVRMTSNLTMPYREPGTFTAASLGLGVQLADTCFFSVEVCHQSGNNNTTLAFSFTIGGDSAPYPASSGGQNPFARPEFSRPTSFSGQLKQLLDDLKKAGKAWLKGIYRETKNSLGLTRRG